MTPEEIFERINARAADEVVQAVRADPSLARARDEGLGSTPLIFASHRGLTEVVAALLEAGAEVDAREAASGTTALHWAAEGGHADVARRLLDRGAALEPIDGWHGLTPLGWGTLVDWAPRFREDRPATIALLLARGAAIDIFCAIGRGSRLEAEAALARDPAAAGRRLGFVLGSLQPLHLAVSLGRAELVDLLLARGADPTARTDGGLTPLAISRARSAPAISERLIAAGAREDAACAVVRDDLPALEASLPGPDSEWLGRLLRTAAERGAARVIPRLVAAGADPQGTGRSLISERAAEVGPLHLAARSGRTEAVAALLDAGALPQGPASLATPLHLAAGGGHLAAVRLLAERGAPPGARDRLFGATPAGWAQHAGHAGVAAWLESRGGG